MYLVSIAAKCEYYRTLLHFKIISLSKNILPKYFNDWQNLIKLLTFLPQRRQALSTSAGPLQTRSTMYYIRPLLYDILDVSFRLCKGFFTKCNGCKTMCIGVHLI